jgi:hypothetical protein
MLRLLLLLWMGMLGSGRIMAQSSSAMAPEPSSSVASSSSSVSMSIPTTSNSDPSPTSIASGEPIPKSHVALPWTCPNDCSGIGVCLPSGTCECPTLDSKTGIRWFTPPSEDCSHYGASAFGVEFITFQVSWALLYIFGFGLMITLVRTLYKENGDMFPDNVKGFCFLLITLGLFVRAWFFTIDPYSLRGIMSTFFNRILYNIFYPVVLMAYCVMLLQW